jgi:hypothetical protein
VRSRSAQKRLRTGSAPPDLIHRLRDHLALDQTLGMLVSAGETNPAAFGLEALPDASVKVFALGGAWHQSSGRRFRRDGAGATQPSLRHSNKCAINMRASANPG